MDKQFCVGDIVVRKTRVKKDKNVNFPDPDPDLFLILKTNGDGYYTYTNISHFIKYNRMHSGIYSFTADEWEKVNG